MTSVTSNAPTGTPTWLDLGIPDLGRAREFYGELFGWEFEDYGEEAGHYHGCLLRGEPVAGMMKNPDPDATSFWWGLYFATDDCDGTVKRALDAGGTEIVPAMDVMGQGRMAILGDAVGAQFGLWQGGDLPGAKIVNEPGSFSWNELTTSRPGLAREFYAALFGYSLEPMPGDLDYTALNRSSDGVAVGGIYGLPEATSSSWLTYFEVEDPDVSTGVVRTGGGTVVDEPADTPYGRMAKVKDPFGTEFYIIKSAPRMGS
ncbi:VOC family protein [Spirillospora sp. CA-294931]|uniref:VOC family protein n=1 Tax=Spirillospora sp. CA-294931 TaxID=3240042 RepID=UPI003D8EBC2B